MFEQKDFLNNNHTQSNLFSLSDFFNPQNAQQLDKK